MGDFHILIRNSCSSLMRQVFYPYFSRKKIKALEGWIICSSNTQSLCSKSGLISRSKSYTEQGLGLAWSMPPKALNVKLFQYLYRKLKTESFRAKHSNSCMISIYAFLFVCLAYILFQLMHRSVVQSTQIQLVVKDRLHPSTLVSQRTNVTTQWPQLWSP